jgi:hypothetical protein
MSACYLSPDTGEYESRRMGGCLRPREDSPSTPTSWEQVVCLTFRRYAGVCQAHWSLTFCLQSSPSSKYLFNNSPTSKSKDTFSVFKGTSTPMCLSPQPQAQQKDSGEHHPDPSIGHITLKTVLSDGLQHKWSHEPTPGKVGISGVPCFFQAVPGKSP